MWGAWVEGEPLPRGNRQGRVEYLGLGATLFLLMKSPVPPSPRTWRPLQHTLSR